jgi:hypothetical protein
MAPTIVTRSQWGARAPKGSISTTTWGQRVGVAIHHSAGPTTQTVRAIQDYQMDSNGWVDIGYNFLATQDGRLWEGRQGTWSAIGAHAANQNTAWVGVCWIGTSGSTAPTAAALSTLRWVWEEAQRRAGRRLLVSGHGQLPGQATECPGSRLRAWIAAGLPTQEDDMALSAEDKEWLLDRLRFVVDGKVWAGQGEGRLAHGTYAVGVGARNGWAYGKVALAEVKTLRSELGAVRAAVLGQDVSDQVAQLAGQLTAVQAVLALAADERAAILTLVEQVGSGERDAGQVVDEIARRLAA